MINEEYEIPQTDEDIENLREKLLAQARLQKSQMVRLLENADWKAYALHIQREIDQRYLELLQMPNSADDVIKKTYCMGELASLKLAQDMPSVLIEYAQTSIDNNKREMEIENGEDRNTEPEFGLFDPEPSRDLSDANSE